MSSKMFSTTLLQAGSFLQCTKDNQRYFAVKTCGVLQSQTGSARSSQLHTLVTDKKRTGLCAC